MVVSIVHEFITHPSNAYVINKYVLFGRQTGPRCLMICLSKLFILFTKLLVQKSQFPIWRTEPHSLVFGKSPPFNHWIFLTKIIDFVGWTWVPFDGEERWSKLWMVFSTCFLHLYFFHIQTNFWRNIRSYKMVYLPIPFIHLETYEKLEKQRVGEKWKVPGLHYMKFVESQVRSFSKLFHYFLRKWKEAAHQ